MYPRSPFDLKPNDMPGPYRGLETLDVWVDCMFLAYCTFLWVLHRTFKLMDS